MQFINPPSNIFGLDISDLSLKAVQVRQKGGMNYITSFNNIEVPPAIMEEGVVQNKKKMLQLLKELLANAKKEISTQYCVMSLPEPKTFIKVIEAEVKDSQIDTNTNIKNELQKHIPINIEELRIDWQWVETKDNRKKFLVGAVPKKIVDEYISLAENAGLKVVAFEVEAQAIERAIIPHSIRAKNLMNQLFIKKYHPKQKNKSRHKQSVQNPKIIMDLGATRTSVVLIDDGIIQFANSLSHISGEKMTKTIMEEQNLNYSKAEKAKIICGTNPKKCKGAVKDIMENLLDDIAKEIINTDNFYQDHFGKETHQLEIILCGGGANMSGIAESLEKKIKRKVSIADPLLNVSHKLPKKINNLMSYTTAIGLALRNYIK